MRNRESNKEKKIEGDGSVGQEKGKMFKCLESGGPSCLWSVHKQCPRGEEALDDGV